MSSDLEATAGPTLPSVSLSLRAFGSDHVLLSMQGCARTLDTCGHGADGSSAVFAACNMAPQQIYTSASAQTEQAHPPLIRTQTKRRHSTQECTTTSNPSTRSSKSGRGDLSRSTHNALWMARGTPSNTGQQGSKGRQVVGQQALAPETSPSRNTRSQARAQHLGTPSAP